MRLMFVQVKSPAGHLKVSPQDAQVSIRTAHEKQRHMVLDRELNLACEKNIIQVVCVNISRLSDVYMRQ